MPPADGSGPTAATRPIWPARTSPVPLGDGDDADYVDQDVEHGEDCGQRPSDEHDPAHVTNHVTVFLCRPSGEEALAGGAAGARRLIDSSAVPHASPARLRGPVLGDDLRLELGRSRLLGSRQGARRPYIGA